MPGYSDWRQVSLIWISKRKPWQPAVTRVQPGSTKICSWVRVILVVKIRKNLEKHPKNVIARQRKLNISGLFGKATLPVLTRDCTLCLSFFVRISTFESWVNIAYAKNSLSQLSPEKPDVHWHVRLSSILLGTHTPLFWHGLRSQGARP